MLEEITEDLESVVKLRLCLRSYNSNAKSYIENKLCSKNEKQGIFYLKIKGK